MELGEYDSNYKFLNPEVTGRNGFFFLVFHRGVMVIIKVYLFNQFLVLV